MRTLNDNFVAAMSKGRIEPRFRVTIWTSTTACSVFLSGKSTVVDPGANFTGAITALKDPDGGSITAFADAGGGQVTVTSALHGLSNGDEIVISSTTNYNGTFTVANVATNTFEITAAWAGDDATGLWRSSTNYISASADAGYNRIRYTSTGHGLAVGDEIDIVESYTNNTQQSAKVVAVAANTFDIVGTFVTTDVGNWYKYPDSIPTIRVTSAAHGLQAGQMILVVLDTPIVYAAEYSPSQILVADTNTFDVRGRFPGTDTGDWYVAKEYSESVARVSEVNRSLNPITRESAVDECTVTMINDIRVRNLLTSTGIYNRRVFIDFGTADLDQGDFEPYFSGNIVEPQVNGNEIAIRIKATGERLRYQTTQYSPVRKHPLDVMKTLIESRFADTALRSTFLFDSDLDTSHWIVSHAGVHGYYEDRAFREPVDSLDILQDLLLLTGGMLRADARGLLKHVPYDTSTSVADLTTNDFSDLRVVNLYGNMANRIMVKSHSYYKAGTLSPAGDDAYRARFIAEDTDSQARYASIVPGYSSEDCVRDHVVEADWLSAFSTLHGAATDVSPATTDDLVVRGGELWSFCGLRGWDHRTGAPISTNAELSDDRIAYLRIDDEIISVDRATIDVWGYAYLWDDTDPDGYRDEDQPGQVTFRVLERGALGTTAAAHDDGAEVIDITIAVAIAQRLLARMANGLWEIEIRVAPKWIGLEHGDIITLTTNEFMAYGVTSLTTAIKWEIIQVRKDIYSDEPGIFLTLAFAGNSAPPAATNVYEIKGANPVTAAERLRSSAETNDVGQACAISGFTFTDDGGLVGTIGAGTASWLHGNAPLPKNQQHTHTANKDTYWGWDPSTNMLLLIETAVAAGTPDKQDGVMWLWKVTTDAADITATEDLRETKAIPGSSLKEGTGPLTHLSSAGALDNITSVTARSLDNITDGATYARVKGAGLTDGVVNSTGLVANAVVAGKIADSAVNAPTLFADSVVPVFGLDKTGSISGSALNMNRYSTQRSKG